LRRAVPAFVSAGASPPRPHLDDMRVGSLNHVVLTVDDLPRSRAFYSELLAALGYRVTYDDAALVGFSGADRLAIYLAAAPPTRRGAAFDRYRVGLHHLAFNAPDRAFVEEIHDKVRALGAKVLDPPAEYPEYAPGYYAVFFLDPDGMKLEVVHVP
jgi:catechol 2,3-dioxygenase-like lactoylglutathione lyase family enzyme